MSNTLTLNPSGTNGCVPDDNPWHPDGGQPVTIVNNSGFDQTLANVTPGLLAPAQQGTITVPTTGWSGHVGRGIGTYEYDDDIAGADVRTGTIDPYASRDVRDGTIDP